MKIKITLEKMESVKMENLKNRITFDAMSFNDFLKTDKTKEKIEKISRVISTDIITTEDETEYTLTVDSYLMNKSLDFVERSYDALFDFGKSIYGMFNAMISLTDTLTDRITDAWNSYLKTVQVERFEAAGLIINTDVASIEIIEDGWREKIQLLSNDSLNVEINRVTRWLIDNDSAVFYTLFERYPEFRKEYEDASRLLVLYRDGLFMESISRK